MNLKSLGLTASAVVLLGVSATADARGMRAVGRFPWADLPQEGLQPRGAARQRLGGQRGQGSDPALRPVAERVFAQDRLEAGLLAAGAMQGEIGRVGQDPEVRMPCLEAALGEQPGHGDAGGLVLVDEHDIVYRGEGGGVAPAVPAPVNEAWRREIRPDPLLLFRYSAVTFNGHRIHYDHPYATRVEGYPGLVVHGPLIATLLVDLLRRERPGVTLRSYSFRALRPLFDTANFHACGVPEPSDRSARLWTRDHEGAATMEATAGW